MKHLLTLLYLSLLMSAVASCGSCRHLSQTVERRDSVSVIYRDSVVFRIDSVTVEIPEESSGVIVPASEPSHLEIDAAYSDAYIDSLGRLHHSLNGLPRKLTLPVAIPEHTLTVDRAHTSGETLTVTKYVERPLSWWQRFWIRAGQLLLALAVLLVVAKALLR